MVFACTQENLLQGLSLVSHIAGKSANLPILAHVLMKTEGGGLRLATTNLEMAVSAQVRGRVDAQGEFTVPAKLLLDYVSLLPAGKVELVLEGDSLQVKADGKTTSIKGLPSSEFPLIPKLTKDGGYHLKADALRGAIGQVAFAVSASESRPELGGVACFFRGLEGRENLVMAATDSYRLTERILPLAGGRADEAKCIVPARAMQEIARILSAYKDEVATPETVEWAMTDSQLVCSYGNVELISRLIEGSFPPYRQIIPASFKTTCTVARAEFAKAIRAASLFSRQGLFDVHLELSSDGLTVSSSDSGTGTHSATLKAQVEGDSNKVTVNYKYVNDGLAAVGSDEVLVRVIDGMNPVSISPKGDDLFRYIVMPIRQ